MEDNLNMNTANAGASAVTKNATKKSLFSTKNNELSDTDTTLIKSAFTAGTGITPQDQTGAAALRIESLDTDIKMTTWGKEDFTIYNDIFHVPVHQTVRKYTVFYQHGKVGHSVFQPEIGINKVNEPGMAQKTVNMKFLVDTKAQSFAIMLADTIANPEEVNEIDSIAVIAKTVEYGIFYGDSELTHDAAGSGNGLEFDGLAKLIDEGNHLDLRGTSITPEVFNKAATVIGTRGFGTATDAYMPLGVKADFINQFLGAQRILIPADGKTTAGLSVDEFISARGKIKLNGSTIMDMDNKLDLTSPADVDSPTAPTMTATVETAQGGQFADEAFAAKYNTQQEVGQTLTYRAVAVGHHGDSLPSDPVTAKVANATDGVKLTVSFDAIQREMPDYVAIYRQGLSDKDSDFYLIKRVPMNQLDSNGNITFTDVNDVIPETADVFVLEMRPNVLSLLELAPISKLNLATVTTATQFAVLTYCALALYYPRRAVMIHNVRQATYSDKQYMDFSK